MKHRKYELLFYTFFSILVGVEISIIIWICTMPYNAASESVESFVAYLWGAMFFGGMLLLNITAAIIKQKKRNTGMFKYGIFILIYFVVIIVNIVTGSIRANIKEGLISEFSGVVIEKYRDPKNHNVPVLVVKQPYKVKLMNFSDTFWDNVKIGDSISKKQWSPYAEINQKRYYYLQYYVAPEKI